MSEILRELSIRIPLRVTESEYSGSVLRLAGPDWRLRVSGAWRLIRGRLIESSSGMEEAGGAATVAAGLVGLEVREIQFQSRHAPLDIALTMSDDRILETFGEYYDDWLLTVGDIILEGPMQSQ